MKLTDWPPGASSRGHAVHKAYLQAARRTRRGAKIEYVSPGDVAKRDKWRCAACGQPVLSEWDADQLGQAPALAFTTAVADGGAYTKGNVRLAHYGCATPADPYLRRALERALVGDLTVKVKATGGDERCTEGHLLAGDNLLASGDGRRRCKTCRRDRERAERTALRQVQA